MSAGFGFPKSPVCGECGGATLRTGPRWIFCVTPRCSMYDRPVDAAVPETVSAVLPTNAVPLPRILAEDVDWLRGQANKIHKDDICGERWCMPCSGVLSATRLFSLAARALTLQEIS